MNRKIDFQGKQVHYNVSGEGNALVFLHGYLESSQIWNGFVDRFVKTHKVICIDLPGHGKSEVIAHVHTMELMAQLVNTVVEEEKIDNLVLFGHSLGGYVTMEYVNQYLNKIQGYCLFHSTCFADDEDKKLNRDREISLVKCGKKMQIIRTNIPKAFADNNLDVLKDRVNETIEIAAMSPNEGIVALLRGMKERNDHSKTLMNPDYTPLLIWGQKDNYIGEDAFKKLLNLAPHASQIVLKNSGHMGFIEEADCAYSGIMTYLDSLKPL
jgi:pimeloyl-ACP methyl ester carboxylesterase